MLMFCSIVLIHGLTGNREKTWKHANGTYWPQDLLPKDLKHARISVFGYDADVVRIYGGVAGSNKLMDHGKSLTNAILNQRQGKLSTRPIIFVAHSLGGLVCKAALTLSDRRSEFKCILDSTIGVIFMGTPHDGAYLAKWAVQVAKYLRYFRHTNKDVLRNLKPGSPDVQQVGEDFHYLLRRKDLRLEVFCFYEELRMSTFVGKIVEDNSAILPGYENCSIHSDHRNMTKFASKTDAGYASLLGVLTRWIERPLADRREQAPDNSHPTLQPLGSDPGGKSSSGSKAPFNVPFRKDYDFVERGDILDQIHERCSRPAGRAALVGLGGVGYVNISLISVYDDKCTDLTRKSQLAIEYAHRIRRQSPDISVFWLYASNEARVEESYKQVAEVLKLEGRKDPSTNVLQLVVDYLNSSKSGKWLMIVDNVDTHIKIQSRKNNAAADIPLAKFLPQSDNGSILITSRYHDVSRDLVGREKDIVSIATMDKKEALQLLKNKLSAPADDKEATLLVEELDCIPLAVSQAAAYINRMQPVMSISKYIEKLKDARKRHKLLMHAVPDDRRDDQASSSPLGTWQVTFDHIQAQSSSAADLLAFMSFFNRHGIPEFMMRHYKDRVSSRDSDDDEDDDSSAEVRTISSKAVSVKSAKAEDESATTDEQQEDKPDGNVNEPQPPIEPGITWTTTEHTLRPVPEEDQPAVPNKGIHQAGSDDLSQDSDNERRTPDDERHKSEDEDSDDDEAFEDDVALLCGFSLISTTNRGKDFQMHGLVQVATLTMLRESNTEELVGRRFINALYEEFPVVAFENWPQCRQLFPHVDLDVEKITSRKNDIRKWADVLYQAAWYLEEQGFFRPAEVMVRDSLSLTERTFGKEDNVTLDHLNLLGDVLDDLGDYTAAEETYRDCLALREKAFGKENPPTRTMQYVLLPDQR